MTQKDKLRESFLALVSIKSTANNIIDYCSEKICDAYMTYICSCTFVENNLVDKKVSQKFKDVIVEQSNSIK